MAQMPASYLTEKIDDLRVGLVSLNAANGLIDLGAGTMHRNRLRLDEMKLNAQAIIDEINEWTGASV